MMRNTLLAFALLPLMTVLADITDFIATQAQNTQEDSGFEEDSMGVQEASEVGSNDIPSLTATSMASFPTIPADANNGAASPGAVGVMLVAGIVYLSVL